MVIPRLSFLFGQDESFFREARQPIRQATISPTSRGGGGGDADGDGGGGGSASMMSAKHESADSGGGSGGVSPSSAAGAAATTAAAAVVAAAVGDDAAGGSDGGGGRGSLWRLLCRELGLNESQEGQVRREGEGEGSLVVATGTRGEGGRGIQCARRVC